MVKLESNMSSMFTHDVYFIYEQQYRLKLLTQKNHTSWISYACTLLSMLAKPSLLNMLAHPIPSFDSFRKFHNQLC
jgi:hypothetical protein